MRTLCIIADQSMVRAPYETGGLMGRLDISMSVCYTSAITAVVIYKCVALPITVICILFCSLFSDVLSKEFIRYQFILNGR